MDYPATQPLYILMAPLRVGHMGFAPCLDTPLRRCSVAASMGSCRSVAVTCFAPLITFIYYCYDALYII